MIEFIIAQIYTDSPEDSKEAILDAVRAGLTLEEFGHMNFPITITWDPGAFGTEDPFAPGIITVKGVAQ